MELKLSEEPLTDLPPASASAEFVAATTQPSTEKLFEERQRVISEWIDDINKADVALGGSLEPSGIEDSIPAVLVERMHPKYTATWEDMLQGRDFVSAGMIIDAPKEDPNLVKDILMNKTRLEKYKNVFFGTLADGSKVLELVRIVKDNTKLNNDHGGFSISTETVTDNNKAEVHEVVSNRLSETFIKQKELAEKKRLSSLPRVELPQT